MNVVYQSLFPASLLPWFILCLSYLVKGYISLFLVLAIHICTQATVILHLPGLKMSMVEWNRILHLQRLALWITYAFRNQWNQHFISLFLFSVIGLNKIIVKKYGEKVMNLSLHALFVLTFCSTARPFQLILAFACMAAFYYMKLPLKVQWDMHDRMRQYFLVRIAYNYLFSVVEWSVSGLNFTSLFVMVFVSVVFNACVFFNTPKQENEPKDEWYVPKSLPEDYPYPLNIKDAIERCNTAKKLFKSHEL